MARAAVLIQLGCVDHVKHSQAERIATFDHKITFAKLQEAWTSCGPRGTRDGQAAVLMQLRKVVHAAEEGDGQDSYTDSARTCGPCEAQAGKVHGYPNQTMCVKPLGAGTSCGPWSKGDGQGSYTNSAWTCGPCEAQGRQSARLPLTTTRLGVPASWIKDS